MTKTVTPFFAAKPREEKILLDTVGKQNDHSKKKLYRIAFFSEVIAYNITVKERRINMLLFVESFSIMVCRYKQRVI